MAQAVYATMAADAKLPKAEKRAIVLVVDTPGNGPGKLEEIFGMNKATGAYQLALAEARMAGHPIVITSYSIHYTKLYDRLGEMADGFIEIALPGQCNPQVGMNHCKTRI